MSKTRRSTEQQRSTLVLLALGMCIVMGCGDGSHDAGESGEPAAVNASAKMLTGAKAGSLCQTNKECGNGSCEHVLPGVIGASETPAPDGFCSFRCRLNADCGEGGMCVGAGSHGFSFGSADETGLCLAICDADRPCREGYSCLDAFRAPLEDGMSVAGSTLGTCQPTPSDE